MPLDTTLPDALARNPGAAKMGLAIRWVFPSGDGSATRLEPGVTAFGRDPSCGGCLPSASVSRKHAEIRWGGDTVPMLRDLESRNGVFLNGRVVKQAPLKVRDVLRIGDWIGVLVPIPLDGSTGWRFEELAKGYWAGPTLLAALAPARLVAPANIPIIIQGATGVGKEGVARLIHTWSGRSGPFLAVNCAALPESLAEAQLFGHKRGAFSGADRASPGYLRAAHEGTLFLDEIAELPLTIQAKLLRALEQNEVIPLGEAMPVPIDVRILTATQGSLARLVNEKKFRDDLHARLEGLTVMVPPLRERTEEIPFLFTKLLEQFRAPAAPLRLDPLLIERLCSYDWPRNVRELAKLAERMVALNPGAAVLDESTLPQAARAEDAAASGATDAPPEIGEAPSETPDPTPDAFIAALRANRGNIKQAAATLGISRGRAYRLMERIGSIDLAEMRQDVAPLARAED